MKIMSLRMGSPLPSSSTSNSNHKIMVDELEGDGGDDFGFASTDTSSINSSSISEDDTSSETEHGEEASSPPSASSLAGPTSSAESASDALQDMSDLMQQLPFKRGLSNFFDGKSQSFSSLANVRSLEDLPKPENPYNKKLKSCKSCAFLSTNHHHHHQHRFPRTCSSSRLISKRAPSHPLTAKRNPSFLGLQRPPAAPSSPHRSPSTGGFQNQIPLIA